MRPTSRKYKDYYISSSVAHAVESPFHNTFVDTVLYVRFVQLLVNITFSDTEEGSSNPLNNSVNEGCSKCTVRLEHTLNMLISCFRFRSSIICTGYFSQVIYSTGQMTNH